MASHALITGAPRRAPFIPAPPAAITRILARFDRREPASFTAVAIDLLDVADGDPDFEEPHLEDSFVTHAADGPGCPVADIDRCAARDDDPNKLFGDGSAGDPDDAEDDDPGGTDIDLGEGVGDNGNGLLADLPIYAVDQVKGPLNYVLGHRAYDLRRMGFAS